MLLFPWNHPVETAVVIVSYLRANVLNFNLKLSNKIEEQILPEA